MSRRWRVCTACGEKKHASEIIDSVESRVVLDSYPVSEPGYYEVQIGQHPWGQPIMGEARGRDRTHVESYSWTEFVLHYADGSTQKLPSTPSVDWAKGKMQCEPCRDKAENVAVWKNRLRALRADVDRTRIVLDKHRTSPPNQVVSRPTTTARPRRKRLIQSALFASLGCCVVGLILASVSEVRDEIGGLPNGAYALLFALLLAPVAQQAALYAMVLRRARISREQAVRGRLQRWQAREAKLAYEHAEAVRLFEDFRTSAPADSAAESV